MGCLNCKKKKEEEEQSVIPSKTANEAEKSKVKAKVENVDLSEDEINQQRSSDIVKLSVHMDVDVHKSITRDKSTSYSKSSTSSPEVEWSDDQAPKKSKSKKKGKKKEEAIEEEPSKDKESSVTRDKETSSSKKTATPTDASTTHSSNQEDEEDISSDRTAPTCPKKVKDQKTTKSNKDESSSDKKSKSSSSKKTDKEISLSTKEAGIVSDKSKSKPTSSKTTNDQKSAKSMKKEGDTSDTPPSDKPTSPKIEDGEKKKEKVLTDPISSQTANDDPKAPKAGAIEKLKGNLVTCIKPSESFDGPDSQPSGKPPKSADEPSKTDSTRLVKGDSSSSKKLRSFFPCDPTGSESVRHSQASESNSAAVSSELPSGKNGMSNKEGVTGVLPSCISGQKETGEQDGVSPEVKETKPQAQSSSKKHLVVRADKILVDNASKKPTSKEEKAALEKLNRIKKLPFPDNYHPREDPELAHFDAHFDFKTYLPSERALALLQSTQIANETKKHEDKKMLVLESQTKCICSFSPLNDQCAGRLGLRCSIKGPNSNQVMAVLSMVEYMDPAIIYYAIFDKPPLDSCSLKFRHKSKGMIVRRFVKPLIY